ncbi:MAG: class I SAM-dependent methyltransferase [Planctomycetaceae bacterium]|nr:class I SAM-dependent methyltransferase [Planctomycetaceae bacterium]
MGTGYLPDDVLGDVMNELIQVPGDFAEIGVFRGALFKRLVAVAQVLKRRVHGFDSFVGMAEPTQKDAGRYQKGELSVGGVETFRTIILNSIAQHRQLAQAQQNAGVLPGGISNDCFQLWEGYVPDCLNACPIKSFAFIYIDLDHHDPTQQAIHWAWPRLAAGGILGFDDYFPGRERLASPPIDQFLEEHHGDLHLVHFSNNQLFIRKRAEGQAQRHVA